MESKGEGAGEGEDEIGEPKEFYTYLNLKEKAATGAERLAQTGVTLNYADDKAKIAKVAFFSEEEQKRLLVRNEIIEVNIPQPQPDRRLMFIPALLLLGVVIVLQRSRSRKEVALKA